MLSNIIKRPVSFKTLAGLLYKLLYKIKNLCFSVTLNTKAKGFCNAEIIIQSVLLQVSKPYE